MLDSSICLKLSSCASILSEHANILLFRREEFCYMQLRKPQVAVNLPISAIVHGQCCCYRREALLVSYLFR